MRTTIVVNRKHTTNKQKKKSNNKTKKNKYKKRYSLGAVFDKHIKCEFQDVDATMKTPLTLMDIFLSLCFAIIIAKSLVI
ncbi:MAG: hypothetical protein ACJ72S_02770 [Nitrososphaeraceae archaeon]